MTDPDDVDTAAAMADLDAIDDGIPDDLDAEDPDTGSVLGPDDQPDDPDTEAVRPLFPEGEDPDLDAAWHDLFEGGEPA